jgi:hypothetical protein
VLEFHRFLCFQLVYFILLNLSLIWDVFLRLLLLPSCNLIATDWICSRVAGCWGSEVVFIILIDVFFEIVLFFLVFVGILILNVFIVSVIVRWLLRLLILRLLILLLFVIADSEVRSNYLHFCVLFINWLLRIHIRRCLRLFVNYKINVFVIRLLVCYCWDC